MEAKRMPAETAIPSEQKSHTMDTIPQRRPFGQAVPFAGYEKAAGSAKELVRLGREVCPKFDKSNYSKAKKPDATGISSTDIYRNTVKQLGISQLIVINAAAAPAFKRVWEQCGIGWFVDDVDEDTGGSVILRAYYGSSTYNRKQMAALIDLVVQDCKQLGIETLTARELSLLCDRWEGERNGKVQGRAKHNAG